MCLKVRNILLANEQRMYTITGPNDLPPDWFTSFFISNELYLDNRSLSTLRNNVYAFKFFLEWLAKNSIDLVTRIKRGKFLNDGELSSFILSAKLGNDSKKKVVDLKPYISAKYIHNSIHGTKVAGRMVKPGTTGLRIVIAVRYLDFLFRHLNSGVPPRKIIQEFERIKFDLLEAKPRASYRASLGPVFDGFNSVIPDAIYQNLLQIIEPDHKNNPFAKNAKRNRLIVHILCFTGIRRGALLKIKLQDLLLSSANSILRITRTPRDKDDPRTQQPAQKTREHTSYLSPEIVREINDYIVNERSQFTNAYSHDFLFVTSKNSSTTERGSPLSISALDAIFKKLSVVLSFQLHPHLLRHKCNEEISLKAERTGYAMEEIEKIRIDAMGWSKGSDMPARYDQYVRLQKVHQLQKLMQEELLQYVTPET